MFTQEEYINAWLLYILGAGLMIACWWYLSLKIVWRDARQLSRIFVAVCLLFPWYTDTDQGHMAPALLSAIVDALSSGGGAFWRAGMPLLMGLIFAVILSLAWVLWRWWQEQKSKQ